jgi:hypothetical protein
VVPEGGAVEPRGQEGQERALAGEGDALLPVDPQQVRIPEPSRAAGADSAADATRASSSLRSLLVQRIEGMRPPGKRIITPR